VVDSAAKLQELEIKPKKVPRATLLIPDSPMVSFIRCRVTRTWIMLEIRYPRANAHRAIQKKPAVVKAASDQDCKKRFMILLFFYHRKAWDNPSYAFMFGYARRE
jgi:hypothetical protein